MPPANPYDALPDCPEPEPFGSRIGSRFSRVHWIFFGILWASWSTLYVLAVSDGLTDGNGKFSKVLMTPVYTLGGPMIGAWVRDSQSCCLDVSLWILAYAAPIPLAATILQFVWVPQGRGLRVLRLLIWCLAWMIWFASGLPSLAHALF